MNIKKLLRKNKTLHPKTYDKYRSSLIEEEIEKIYSIEDQIGILRQKDTKPEKFQKFFDDVELCIKNIDKQLNSEGNN